MDFPGGIMIFIAAITLAMALNHLYLGFRLKASGLHFIVFFAGLFIFTWFIFVNAGYRSFPEYHLLEGLYRFHLFFLLLSVLAVMLAFAWLTGYDRKSWIMGIAISFLALILATLFVPGRILFGTSPSATIVMLFGAPVTMLADGLIYWRILADLGFLLGVVFSVIMFMHLTSDGNGRGKVILVLFSVILFLVAAADHLVDNGAIASLYLAPFGIFVIYGILSSSSLSNMVKDISKNYELEIKDRKWRLMVNEMKLLIVELNTMGHATYVNPYLLELTGYQESEIMGKDWFELLLPATHSYDVQSAFLEILSNDFHPVYQNPILTKNDEERMIIWHNVRLRDRAGKISGSISIGTDVTDLQDNIEALEKSLAEARAFIDKLQNDKS